ncbi:MAG: divalent-cation tolerance protein CutA [Chromatiaceae bacterium]|jgi:periplasmic divalent cation tolerance protein
MNPTILLTFSTCRDAVTADRIAEALVSEGLAACVNQLPGVRSVFLWQGRVERESEILLLMKTTEARFPALSERLRALHPYELPEIIAVPVTTGLPEYLQWVSKCTAVDV